MALILVSCLWIYLGYVANAETASMYTYIITGLILVLWLCKCMCKMHGAYIASKFSINAGNLPTSSTCRPHTVYPKKYAHGLVVLCFVVVMQSLIMNSHEVFIHIHQGCFAGTGAIVRLPQCQWSKPDGYGKISQCITTTKHSKAKTVHTHTHTLHDKHPIDVDIAYSIKCAITAHFILYYMIIQIFNESPFRF